MTCPDCGYERCRCDAIRTYRKWERHCRYCPNGGLLTQHGLCMDPFGDKGICYCFAQNDSHRLQHEMWIAPDDDSREGYDGLDSSKQIVDWQDDRRIAAAHAARTGSKI